MFVSEARYCWERIDSMLNIKTGKKYYQVCLFVCFCLEMKSWMSHFGFKLSFCRERHVSGRGAA